MSTAAEWIASFENLFRRPFSSFYRIETAIDERTLVSTDGSLATIVRLDGMRNETSLESESQTIETLLSKISSGFARQGHAVEFVFSLDPARSKPEIARQVAVAKNAAKRLDLDIEDVLDERTNWLSKFVLWESAVFVIWTRTSAVGKEELKIAAEAAQRSRKGLPPRRSGQNYMLGYPIVLQKHKGFVDMFVNALTDVGLRAKVLGAHTAVAYQRNAIYPGSVDVNRVEQLEDAKSDLSDGKSWRPYLPGDKIPMRYRAGKPDVGDLTWPALPRQIFRSGVDFDEQNPKYPIIEENAYACVDIDVPPEKIPSGGFQDLLNAVISSTDEHGRHMPVRIRYLIETAGMFRLAFKQIVAQIGAAFSDSNRRINDAIKYLKEISNSSDPALVDKVVALRISACTWAPRGQWDLLRSREAALKSSFEQWGGALTTTAIGDPIEGVVSTLPAMDIASTASTAVAPLRDVLSMMPFNRPAPPMQEGLVLFRSEDGKLWPHSPGRKSQMVVQLVCGQPGAGKSVLLNQLNLATVLSQKTIGASTPRLPRIAIIDIGPSSSGFISILKESLPAHRKNEVQFYQMRMTADDAVNPLDTQLGCRRPMPLERAFIENFVGLITTPLETGKPYDSMMGLVTMAIDYAYKFRDPEIPGSSPHVYEPGAIPEVDRALREHHINVASMEEPYWWEIVDLLFDKGAYVEAELAQTYAVPNLEDMARAASSTEIGQRFAGVKTPANEDITNAFSRLISQTLTSFPILNGRTRLNFAGARIVAIDLQNVAGRTMDPMDVRRTAVSYMLARKALAGDFYVTLEEATMAPDRYRKYHAKRIADMREQPKRLHYDEFHRTGGAPQIRSQLVVDIREGRKYDVEIALASQDIDDFDKAMMEFATELYVMGKGSGDMPERIAERFKLGRPTLWAMRNRLRAPSSRGATAIVKLVLEDGEYERFVMATTGPIELWAYSTSQQDTEVRRKLYAELGPREARKLLAGRFPGGSAKTALDMLKEKRIRSGALSDEADKGAIDELVSQLLEDYRKTPV